MKNPLRFSIFIFLLTMCIQNPENEAENKTSSRSIEKGVLIIIDQRYEPEKMPTKGGLVNINKPQLRYIDDLGNEQKFISEFTNSKDSIFITSDRPHISIQHRYFQMDKFDYLFKNGDTVLFTYQKGIPYALIMNQVYSELEANYEFYKRMRFDQLGHLQGQKYYDLSNFEHTRAEDSIFAQQTIKINRLENEYLDSLFSKGSIRYQVHYFHKKRLQFEMYEMSLSKKYGKYFLSYIAPGIIETHIKTNKLAHHKFFLDAIVKYVKVKYELSQIRSSSASYLNYRQAFDSMAANRSNFNSMITDIMLNRFAEGVIINFSFDESKEVMNQFSMITENKNMIKDLKERYLMSEDFDKLKEKAGTLMLLSKDKKIFEFNEIKEKYRDKLIYIDFWASWCSPCRQAIPASHKLKKDYSSKDVVFIYLSTDHHFNNWKKAINQLDLEYYSDSYLMLNNEKSDLINQLKIKSIPRYILYDQNGNLVHQNAPGPDGEQIRKLLDKYLAE